MKETGPNFDQKLVCSDNLGQNMWNKLEKSSRVRQERKS